MLILEAAILSDMLDRLNPSSVLDIGSGSRADRTIIQPHIGAAFAGHNVAWADLRASKGVLACDLTDKTTLADLPKCDVVTACSILEHVVDIDAAIANLASLVQKWLIVSVPWNYPEHHCPIDNLWRPSPDELADRLMAAGLAIAQKFSTPPETFAGNPGVNVSMVLATR